MGAHIMKYKIIVILLIIISVFQASASIEVKKYDISMDFSVYTSQKSKICTCAQSTDNLIITNTGSFTATFEIISDIKTSDYFVELNPGESKDILLFPNIECNPKIKTHNIKIKSNIGIEKNIEKQFQYEKCQNLEIRLKPTESINAC